MESYKYHILVLGILLGAFILTKILRFFLGRTLKASAKNLKVNQTNYNFLKHAISFIIFVAAVFLIFYIIPGLRKFGLSLFASAGIFAAIVGFASQQAFSNIISGIFLMIFKPYRVDDFIKIGDLYYGKVEDITLRHTVIRNIENRRVIIPNSVISKETIINSSIIDEKICSLIELGISYESNIDHAMEIIRDEAMKHPFFHDKRTDEQKQQGKTPVTVRVISLGEYSVNLRAYVWAENNDNAFVMKCDLYKTIKERMQREGIEIPYPHRSIVMKSRNE